jgi:hypothetical protein
MSTFDQTDGRITGNVISIASELRAPDGTVILTFRVEGTKKSSAMRGGNYSVDKKRQVFTCHAFADAAASARALTAGQRVSVETTTVRSTNHLPHVPDQPPTVEHVTMIFPSAVA